MAVSMVDRLADFLGTAKPQRTAGDTVTGMFRMGGLGQYSGQAWFYSRIVNAVYHNPTGKRCTDEISAAFARAPLTCYAPGDKVRETPVQSPLQSLLNNPVPPGGVVQPVSGKMAARKRARDLTLAGMSLTLKVRNGGLTDGPITSLRRLPAQRVTVIGNHHDELVGFVYHDRAGGMLPLLPQWCVYERFPHPDRDYQGFPPALAAGLAAESDNRAARFNLDLLSNDGAIPAVVMLEGLQPDQFGQWVAAWEAESAPGKVRFMGFKGTPTGGKSVEILKLGQTNEELEYVRLRQVSQEDVGRALGCPPVVYFNLNHETYANADMETKHWYSTTIWDYWDQSSDEMTVQLGSEFGVDLGYALGGIAELQEARDSMVDRQMKLQENRNVTINETNRKLGLPEVPWGDVPLPAVLPMSGAPAPPPEDPNKPPEETPPPAPAPPAPKAALPAFKRRGGAALAIASPPPRETSAPTTADREAALLRAQDRATRRLQRYFAHQGRVIAKRLLSPGRDRSASALIRRGLFDTERWNEELAEDAQAFLADLAEGAGAQIDVEARARELAESVNATTAQQLDERVSAAATAGKSVAEIAEVVRVLFETSATATAAAIAEQAAATVREAKAA